MSAQISDSSVRIHLVLTRLAMKPKQIAEMENSRKKLLPTRPNCWGDNDKSCMIDTAVRPITALSAKLMTMNRNSRHTTIHARHLLLIWNMSLPYGDIE